MSSTAAIKRRAARDSGDTEEEASSSRSDHEEPECKKRTRHKRTAYEMEDFWTVKEKEKLLEALKTFPATSVGSISKYVGTKTLKEVSAKFASIRKMPGLKCSGKGLEDDANKQKAPLESWLPIVQELVLQEPTDLSEHLGKVMSLIGRHEIPNHTVHPQLKWQNIYQYFSDLLEDRAHLQTLTDLEAYVVLDLMHNLGKSLRNMDSEEQCRVLRMKYRLLRSHPLCFPQVANKTDLVAMALSNDFSLLDNDIGKSSSASFSAPLLSSSTDTTVCSKARSRAPHLSQDQESPISSTSTHPGNTSSFPQSSSTPTPNNTPLSSDASTPVVAGIADSRMKSTSSRSSAIDLSMCVVSENGGDSQTSSQISPALLPWTPESSYARPRYFTMNPLCIQQNILDFKVKKS